MKANKKFITDHPAFSSFLKKWWIDSREQISEWYRIYFHTIVVTIMLFVNAVLGYSGLVIYLSRFKHLEGSPEVVLSYFMSQPPSWLTNFLNLFYIPFDVWHWGWMILFFNLPLMNWFYSTITQPIKKRHKTIINWRSPKGRVWALLLSAGSFICIYLGVVSWYVDTYLFDFFDSIRSDKQFLVVNSMTSFGYVLMAAPALLCVFGIYLVAKQFYVFEDLQEQFLTWEFPLLSSQSFSLKNNRADVIVGWEKNTKKPIVIPENSRYLHEIVIGATGTGKSSTTILTRITQDLIRIARGFKMGICVLEPKGDLVKDVLKIAKQLGIPEEKIKIVDPTDIVQSVKFNPFAGPMEAAAESFRGTLDSLSADQDDFFRGQQNETASLYTLLGKIRFDNLFNIHHMQQMYTDPRFLANVTEEVRAKIQRILESEQLEPSQRAQIERYDRVVSYFENEVLEYKTFKSKEGEDLPVVYPEGHRYAGKQIVENKKDKFVQGAKKYLNDIAMNSMLSGLMVADKDDDVLDLDAFLRDGGVLLVNSALGELEELSLLFGQFFIRQFQSAVFRRPQDGELITKYNSDGEEIQIPYERIPIFFSVDEFSLYANEAFERLLTLGRSYKVGTLTAIQNLGQLQRVAVGYDKVILGNSRNKTVFGGGEYDDSEKFSKQFGEEFQIEESLNESSTPWTMPGQRWDHRYNTQRKLTPRFSPTDITELKFKHFIIQRVDEENNILPPVVGIGKFVDETKFIKKFINVGKIELETKKGKPLNIAGYLSNYKKLMSSVLIDERDQAASIQPPLSTEDEDKHLLEEINAAHNIDQESEKQALILEDQHEKSQVDNFTTKESHEDLGPKENEDPILSEPDEKIEVAAEIEEHQSSNDNFDEEIDLDIFADTTLEQEEQTNQENELNAINTTISEPTPFPNQSLPDQDMEKEINELIKITREKFIENNKSNNSESFPFEAENEELTEWNISDLEPTEQHEKSESSKESNSKENHRSKLMPIMNEEEDNI